MFIPEGYGAGWRTVPDEYGEGKDSSGKKYSTKLKVAVNP